jgi:hypothetical protein
MSHSHKVSCCSSVVEHTIGNGEVGSSILPSSTSPANALAPLDPKHLAIRFLDEQVGERIIDIFFGELRFYALKLA